MFWKNTTKDIEKLREEVSHLNGELERVQSDNKQLVDKMMQKEKDYKSQMWFMKHTYDELLSKLMLDGAEQIKPGNREKLLSLKDKYAGKRVFLIGNGPSLKASDLDMIKDEYSFACNRIPLIYKDTVWRPTFYIGTDGELMERKRNDLNLVEKEEKTEYIFLTTRDLELTKQISRTLYFPMIDRFEIPADFSYDILKGVYDARTVVYMALQLIVYMGFREVVLLGMDGGWPTKIGEDGRRIIDFNQPVHFAEEYDDEDIKSFLNSWVDFNNLKECGLRDLVEVWEQVKYFLDMKNVKVLNATRGGLIENYERVQLEELLGADRR